MRASLFLLALPLAAASPLAVSPPSSGDDSSNSSSSSLRGKTKALSVSTATASASETSTDSSSVWAKVQPTPVSAVNSTQAPELVTTAVPSRTTGTSAVGSARPLKDPAVIWPGADDWCEYYEDATQTLVPRVSRRRAGDNGGLRHTAWCLSRRTAPPTTT